MPPTCSEIGRKMARGERGTWTPLNQETRLLAGDLASIPQPFFGLLKVSLLCAKGLIKFLKVPMDLIGDKTTLASLRRQYASRTFRISGREIFRSSMSSKVRKRSYLLGK